MKLLYLSAAVFAFISSTLAGDVQYSVIAFPKDGQDVSVSVGGKSYTLQKSNQHPNIFSGTAPSGDEYRYVITGSSEITEKNARKLGQGVTSTGNEFFDRSQTLYDVPNLPKAFNPVYPTLFTNLDKSNEIATIIMTVNSEQMNQINEAPKEKLTPAQISNFAYISNKEVFTCQNAGISTSGQSTKDFTKQSYGIDLNQYITKGTQKNLLFGRTSFKLRAQETDATFIREKLVLDMLAASGGATLSGSWVRVFINEEAYGLFLLTDDASTHFIDSVLHAGNFKNPTTGVTYKGNALSPEKEGNLVYVGDEEAGYPTDLYKLADLGEDHSGISKKNNSQRLLIDFTKRLSQINVKEATDAQHPGAITNLIDPQHTMIHMAINFLVGSWDGFWYQASNYYLHHDTSSNKWVLITYDFDETFGNALEDARLSTVSYKEYARSGSQRPLVQVFIENQYYDSVFQDILKTIVKRFFKPSIIDPLLNAWSKMLEEDIVWTRSIRGRSPGSDTSYTLKDFQNGLSGNGADSISQWVSKRSSSLTSQLNFKDNDDLPPLPPYNDGAYLDANGNSVTRNPPKSSPGGFISPGGNDKPDSTSVSAGSNVGKNSLFIVSCMAAITLSLF